MATACHRANSKNATMRKLLFLLFIGILAVSGCRNRRQAVQQPQEDLTAKKMLQGIWVNEDEEDVAFQAQGDTIFYPDTTSLPVKFQIIGDTLVLQGAENVKYPIIKQTPHLFVFKNQNGDEVRLTKSENPDDAMAFIHKRPKEVNQNKLIKRDTIVTYNGVGYHCYVTVNPTSYKVIKVSYNDDGVEVDNVYYDNIINLNVYHGATKLFSGDFRKQQFAHIVPKDFLSQAVLSDLYFMSIDQNGVHYVAVLVIPDSVSSFEVELTVSYTGRLQMKVK